MHMHAMTVSEFGNSPPEACIAAEGAEMHGVDPGQPFDFKAQAKCKRMIKGPASDAALIAGTLRMMDRYNIVLGMLEGDPPVIAQWRAAAPTRFLIGRTFFIDGDRPPAAHVAVLEAAAKRGEVHLFAEIAPQYRGLGPDDPSLEPFYAMAERLGIPVGIHMGYGAPGRSLLDLSEIPRRAEQPAVAGRTVGPAPQNARLCHARRYADGR
jgi:hypothetical protein